MNTDRQRIAKFRDGPTEEFRVMNTDRRKRNTGLRDTRIAEKKRWVGLRFRDTRQERDGWVQEKVVGGLTVP